jgi:hypothetical protein
MKIRIIGIYFILLLSLVMTACSTSLQNENDILSKEVISLQEKNTNMENKITDLENTINVLNNDLGILKIRIEEMKESSLRDKDNLYPIYTADSFLYGKIVDAYIYMPKETALKKKLETLAEVMSEVYFSNLPIQVIRIEEIDKKKIVIVNLKESAENQGITDYEKLVGKTWTTHYMQGSTGGTITETILIETMLQRDYKGQWIDGVQFLYNSGDCFYEHAASLRDVNYRN